MYKQSPVSFPCPSLRLEQARFCEIAVQIFNKLDCIQNLNLNCRDNVYEVSQGSSESCLSKLYAGIQSIARAVDVSSIGPN